MATFSWLCTLLLILVTCVSYSISMSAEVKAAKCAYRRTRAILNLDKERANDGTDTSIASKTTISPGVLGGRDSNLSPLVNPATFINFIKQCNSKIKIRDVLKAKGLPKLIKKNFAFSPYKLSSPCPDVETMKYRRFDGSCNNVAHPLWGSSKIPFIRRLRPMYEKGDKPRQHGKNNALLPSARLVSTTVHTATDQPSTAPVTSFYNGFGQYLSHDIANTPTSTGHKGYPISCCNSTSEHSKCFNIDIPANDPFYGPFNSVCMGFVRSSVGTGLNLKRGVREQINLVTVFVDNSNVYGDGATISDTLVDLDTGKLKVALTDQPPVCMHQNAKARALGLNLFCAGDTKVNESPQLYSTTLLFHRTHNMIVDKLASINSQWDGLKLYQEARRITIAYAQHIVYNEYLPATLSDDTISEYNLLSQTNDYYTGYDATINPTSWNVSPTVAMRFGHSMINNHHVYAYRNYAVDNTSRLELKDAFFRPLTHIVRQMDLDRGSLVTPSEVCDRKFVPGMSGRMFETKPGNGLDIVSLNIQRGRDHGLPPYHRWRKAFNLTAPTDWSASSFPDHAPEVIDLFQQVYASWRDIDVYSGGVAETVVSGKTVGPLFAEMIGSQFDRLKRSDRFWYETGSDPQRFTVEQLQEIRKITLAHLMCSSVDVDDVQIKAFLLHGATNPRVSCSSLNMVNLTKWAE